jgi:hypothetical protein
MRPIAWLSMIGWIALGFVAARGADPVVRELPNKFDASDFPRWREHWAFRAMGHAAPPAVTRGDWVRNDVDRFVLARLEAQGLSPAAEADRLTLLRRASYGLTGLPPTRDEVDAFLADDAPDAWERQVDRLLASPHYGERMARHWLDLARYADSNGLDENLALGNAWRYRDWVVRSFNANESYDRFLTEQLAGDLLPEPADRAQLEDQLTATGFLVLGPKMLAEQDKQKLVMDVVDEQLDVTARTFLGLTAGCARCHDHKFDPLPTRDYYALAGIFKNTATMANLEFVSRWNQRELAPEAEIAARDAHLQRLETANRELAQREAAARDAVRKRWRADLARALVAATDAGASTRVIEAEDFARGNLHVDHEHWGTAEVGVIHTHVGGVQFAEYDVSMPHDGTWHVFARYAQGESRPIRVLADGAVVASSTLDAVTGGFMPEHQRVTRIGSVRWTAGAHVLRIERDSHFPHVDALVLVPEAVASADLTASLVRAAAAHLELERRLANSPWSPWFAIAAARTSEACRDAVDAARAATQDGPVRGPARAADAVVARGVRRAHPGSDPSGRSCVGRVHARRRERDADRRPAVGHRADRGGSTVRRRRGQPRRGARSERRHGAGDVARDARRTRSHEAGAPSRAPLPCAMRRRSPMSRSTNVAATSTSKNKRSLAVRLASSITWCRRPSFRARTAAGSSSRSGCCIRSIR